MWYVWLVLTVVGLVQSALILLSGYYFGDWLEFSSRQYDFVGAVVALPAPTPTPSPRVEMRPFPDSDAGNAQEVVPVREVVITFVDVPQAVRANQPFVVRFRVQAPEGVVGQDAALLLTYSVRKDENGVAVNSMETSRQSFGSFVPPKTFQSELRVAGVGEHIELEAFALVDGRLHSRQITLPLVP